MFYESDNTKKEMCALPKYYSNIIDLRECLLKNELNLTLREHSQTLQPNDATKSGVQCTTRFIRRFEVL